MVDDAELHALLHDLESDRIERKASASDMKKIRRVVCAFANDLPGHGAPGIVFVGVNDDGSCADLSIDDDLLKKLSQLRSNGDILPIPSIQVARRIVDGCELAVIEVTPASAPPVRFAGRVWVRIGPTTQEAGDDDERILRERARHSNQPFDRRPAAGACDDDLDLDFFTREYLPSALDSEVLRRNRRTLHERLSSLRMMVGGVPTYGALLIMGKEARDFIPGAYVQFLRIEGGELGDPIKDRHELTGPLHEVVRQLDDLLKLNISTAVEITGGATETNTPEYPVEALQQLVRNALIHRNYESSNAPVRIYWFRDRVEIHNAGGPFGQVTQSNFATGVTDYRNPLVAEAMGHLGYVQRFGFGIPLAKRLLRDNGNPPPEFVSAPSATLVIVRTRA
jgi:ATP-dependent DNA helicase RecG